jgi:hypothetical protein
METIAVPRFTIETTYRLPIYRHRTYEGQTVEAACRLALEDDDWSGEKQDYETAGQTYVTGIWPGENAAYKSEAIPVSTAFEDSLQRKADHFEALVAVLTEAAQPMGLSRAEFELWLSRAQSALGKAAAICAGLPDPEPPRP